MNQKKNQERTKFTRLRLRSSASVSKKSFSPNPKEKISSYFLSSQSNEPTSQRDSEELFLSTIESQFGQKFSSDDVAESKNNHVKMCEPKSNLEDDENDFAEPKKVKPAKVFKIKPDKVKRKRNRNNNDLSKFVKDFGPSCSDTNREHLNLAYAMSKSLEEFQNPGQSSESQDVEYESPFPSTQQKIATVRSTLDQFGFKTNRSAIEISTLKSNANQKKFKFLTPTLFLRTDEDRAKLIETKVSRIFDNIAIYNKNMEEIEKENSQQEEFVDNKPRSFLLREYYDENSTIFNKNSLDLSEMIESTFYNKTVPQEIVKTGVLLKDWGSIPGRERSPPLINITVEETQYDDSEKQKNSEMNRSISPDLFSDSDSELSINKSPVIHISTQNHLLNKQKSPVIVLSSSSSNKIENSPVFSENDSDAKSLSLLDNISPRRNKNKSPRKNIHSPIKKSLFPTKINSEPSLDIEGIAALDDKKSDSSSPFETLVNQSQICHFESFRDNSNDCFDLTRSSDDSNDIFNADTIINSPNKAKIIDDETVSENLFASETLLTEMGAHDDNYSGVIQLQPRIEKEKFVDLTQSSNELDEEMLKKNAVDPDKSNLKYTKIFEDFEEINTVPLQNNLADENSSNDSVKTVLLQKKYSPEVIEATEEIDTIPLQAKILELKNKFEEDYSPEFDLLNPSNNKDIYKSLSFISDSDSDENLPEKNNPKSPEIKKNFNKSPNKNNRKSFRRSFSESFIADKEFNFVSHADKTDFFKLSSPLNVTNFLSQSSPKNNISINEKPNPFLDLELLNSKKNINDISRSSNDSEINDEEINYSLNNSKLANLFKPSCSKNIDKDMDDEMQYLSQSSIGTSSDISDEELNYSTNISFRKRQSKEFDEIFEDKVEFMDFNDLPDTGFEPTRTSLNINESLNFSEALKHPRIQDLSTPSKLIKPSVDKTPENSNNNPVVITPTNNYIIKTTNVTPMPNFDVMATPEMIIKLKEYGIKPLKRTKAIKILQYIHNATHPFLLQSEKNLERSSDEEDNRVIKRRKTSSNIQKNLSKLYENKEIVECLNNEIANSEKVEEMIFERNQSVRIASCRLPLHIAWHNLVSSEKELHEKILLYEPIQVEEIYGKFKSFGFKFHIQDIIAFLDRKCITIKVAQNNQKKKAGS